VSLVLQARDKTVLKFVYEQRVVSFEQIARVFFVGNHKSIPSRRLKLLRKEGYLWMDFIMYGEIGKRYFGSTPMGFEVIRRSWRFHVDRPLYRSESVAHDLRIVDFVLKLQQLKQFGKFYSENLLQSSTDLAEDHVLKAFSRANSDGCLVIKNDKSETSIVCGFEMEINPKSIERYKTRLAHYYQAHHVDCVLFVCSQQSIINAIAKADAQLRDRRESLLYFTLEKSAFTEDGKLIFRNASGKKLEFV
jgi:hypothetical protein